MFDVPNAHILTVATIEMIQQIVNTVKAENDDDILMTVPFDHNTLTWQINQTKMVDKLQNIANNVHQIFSEEILSDYLH